MLAAAKLFSENGFQTVQCAHNNEKFDLADILKGASAAVLPLPCEKGGILNAPMSNEKTHIGDVFEAGKDMLFIGGGLPRGERFADLSQCEEYLSSCAVATAEAAIGIALAEQKKTLFGSSAAVIGYGRIAKRLVALLNAFGAKTAVVARRAEARILAEGAGAAAFGFESLLQAASGADIIFNTVPDRLFDSASLSEMPKKTLFIDLASGNGAANEEAARGLGLSYIRALALPGRHFPDSAGRYIFDAAVGILRERGMLK